VPRKLREVKRLRFYTDALEPVVAFMDQLVDAEDGWINLVPPRENGEEPPTDLRFSALFSGGGTGITMITWIPNRSSRRRAVGQTLGITHRIGHRAVATLAAGGAGVPAAWKVEQDHPRRGLLVHPPAHEATEPVLTWALRAVDVLEAPRRLTSWWADVHLPAS
jgi:hypothetical protein